MTSKIIQNLINNVSRETLDRFFRYRNSMFRSTNVRLQQYEDDMFTDAFELGKIHLDLIENITVCVFHVSRELTERSGKKAQYDKAKKIIRDLNADAGIFVFIGENDNFRFSLVYANYKGTKVDYSNFRRYTYFVSPELTNKTFIQRIGEGDFSSLESIKDAFSVEKVTKEFYERISYWYFWACQKSRFPKDAESQENGREIAVIRLITRIIFIWFMREMKLVPSYLFEDNFVEQTLKDFEPNDSSYYLAILQNLFFATLNTKPEEREFRSTVRGYKGYNPDFGNQYKFRYQDLFIEPEKLPDYFGDIPFLNGGLFDCLDDKANKIYIDGFTETKKHQPQVPNKLFFSGEQRVDLNKDFGTVNKHYLVEGLINILSTYNFTIDENTLDDKDVALDPELLGRVFENLLASFNPETSTTARKATGSYYTPREIVNYMVEEALKAYFQTHLTDIDDIENKLGILFESTSSENPFTPEETKRAVELVENVRIVDPAVGSGAFPMGALNKLVFLLSKLDKNNALWKEAQLKAADQITDPTVRSKVKESIHTYFKEKDADYGRKLYLIQKCIYGVDIQQIAVEIAKLRFFIALLVDETIDKTRDNWGIEPLPNLDFKIMQGNSLISDYLGIEFSIEKRNLEENVNYHLFDDDKSKLIELLEQKKVAYQTESDHKSKILLRNEIEDLLIQIFESLLREQKSRYFQRLSAIEKKFSVVKDKEKREIAKEEEKQKLIETFGFDLDEIEDQLRQFTNQQRVKPFFPWTLYFAEVFNKGGFDVVIANPPYVRADNPDFQVQRNLIFQSNQYQTLWEKWDLFVPFVEKGLNLLNKNGILVYIISNSILTSKFAIKLLEFIQENYSTQFIDYFSNDTEVFDASVTPVIFGISNKDIYGKVRKRFREDKFDNIAKQEFITRRVFESLGVNAFRLNYQNVLPKTETILLGDICFISVGMVVNADEKTAKGLFVKEDIISETKSGDYSKEYVEGKDITDYAIKHIKYIEWGTSRVPSKIRRPTFKELYNRPKIMKGSVTGGIYDDSGLLCNHSVVVFIPFEKLNGIKNRSISMSLSRNNSLSRHELENISRNFDLKYILAILNSKFTTFYLNNLRRSTIKNYFYPNDFRNLPIADVNYEIQKPFIGIVEKIMRITNSEDYFENQSKIQIVDDFKEKIDNMVYQLYGLSQKDISLIEDSFDN